MGVVFGSFPPLSDDQWIEYFNLYKTIPEFKLQNFNMSLSEFKDNILVGMGTSTIRKINWIIFNTYDLFYI